VLILSIPKHADAFLGILFFVFYFLFLGGLIGIIFLTPENPSAPEQSNTEDNGGFI